MSGSSSNYPFSAPFAISLGRGIIQLQDFLHQQAISKPVQASQNEMIFVGFSKGVRAPTQLTGRDPKKGRPVCGCHLSFWDACFLPEEVSPFGKIRLWLSRLGGCNVVAIFCDSFTSFLSPVTAPTNKKQKHNQVVWQLISSRRSSTKVDNLMAWICWDHIMIDPTPSKRRIIGN